MSKKLYRAAVRKARQKSLEVQLVERNRQVATLTKDIKALDEAIFECIQKSHIGPLGKVVDDVMRRVAEYSAAIGTLIVDEMLSPKPKRKRKARR